MCSICDRIRMIKNGTNSYFVKELETGYVVIGDNQHFKGYSLFLCKEHKTELFQLDYSKKMKFLEEMSIVAEAVSKAFDAEKMNYELLGNGDTHLHWHLFPRRSGDIENYGNNGKGPVWWYPMEKMYSDDNRPSNVELEAMRSTLLEELEKIEYSQVQNIAKNTIEFVKDNIYAGMTLPEIRKMCETKMIELGADSFWYWDVGAFIFAGDETKLSVSGKEYITSKRIIAENDIITIDLSPQNGDTWGDYARTLIIENGKVVENDSVSNDEWKKGLLMEEYLHEAMCKFVTPKTTFEELYYYINSIIEEKGYVNLDFLGNLGHSIVRQKSDRVYIEKGNQISLGDVSYFTFEPHISLRDSNFGFKRENIYYFDNGVVKEL